MKKHDMSIEDFIKLGFKPSLGKDGKEIRYHPEGVTYVLQTENVRIQTTDCYVGYLWVFFDWPYDNKIVSREATEEKIKKILEWKSKNDIQFLD